MSHVCGRFAPSPTGDLHLGNLRTALIAWLSVRSQHGSFVVRMEDLDPVTSSVEHERRQLADLATLGIESDQVVVRQSERFDLYRDAISELESRGLVYACWCTRREIRDAAAAPHGDPLPDGAYPGTCRSVSDAARLRFEREGRRSALRLRTDGERYAFTDQLVGLVGGPVGGLVDDVVLQRNDGVPAYNLAVVVDDHLQGITEVVRGDDLVASTPRQLHLHHLLGFTPPVYAHVPLVLGADGTRLAKRHGAVTLDDLAERGIGPTTVLTMLLASIGLPAASTTSTDTHTAAGQFAWQEVPRTPWQIDEATL